MAEFLKSQSPQALWQASIEPKSPLKPESLLDSLISANSETKSAPSVAAKAPGTGIKIDFSV